MRQFGRVISSAASCGVILALLFAAGTPGQAAEGKPAGKWRTLFDGKTLTGWTPKIVGYPAGEDPLQTFRVRDGAIAVSYDKYGGKLANRFGHLFYKEPFEAYRLSLDYRFTGEQVPNDPPTTKPVNSGVMYGAEAPQLMALDQYFPVTVEAQILGDDPGGEPRTTANLCGMGVKIFARGKTLDVRPGGNVCSNSQERPRPNGTWVHFEFEVAANGSARTSIDGKPAASFDRAELDPDYKRFPIKNVIAAAGGRLTLTGGYIALQSEGHPIEFRNIRILTSN
jgi:hypothetical protein